MDEEDERYIDTAEEVAKILAAKGENIAFSLLIFDNDSSTYLANADYELAIPAMREIIEVWEAAQEAQATQTRH